MRRVAVSCLLALGIMLLAPLTVARATPTPPYLIVNHTTKECAERWIGDDCRWCDPLTGWEVVGLASKSQCPAGYTTIDHVDMDCRGYETPFCCSGGPHRGDCGDMVLHDADRLCAFVDEIEGCVLPEGWTQRPADVSPHDWYCPYGQGWQPDVLPCLTGVPTESAGEGTEATEEPGDTPEPTEVRPDLIAGTEEPSAAVAPTVSTKPPHPTVEAGTIVLLAVAVAVLVVGSLLVWHVVRQRRP